MSTIFLSHSSKDKEFVRQLATDLEKYGADIWLDEAEMNVGDSLIEKIGKGIEDFEYLGVVLSPASIKSEWVKKDVEIALNEEISGKKIKVLPLLKRKCEIPTFLKGKVYADFSKKSQRADSLEKVVRALGLDLENRNRVPGKRMILVRDLINKIEKHFDGKRVEVSLFDDASGIEHIVIYDDNSTFELYSWETIPTDIDLLNEIFNLKGKNKIKEIQMITGGPFSTSERDKVISELAIKHELDEEKNTPLYKWKEEGGNNYKEARKEYDEWLFQISTICLSSKVTDINPPF